MQAFKKITDKFHKTWRGFKQSVSLSLYINGHLMCDTIFFTYFLRFISTIFNAFVCSRKSIRAFVNKTFLGS